VANSLQIIASVLLQSARNVQSEETRDHLENAHHRVLSIAAVQKHLAASSSADVELRPYFTQLCESLGASMIEDPKQTTLEVRSDDGVRDAEASMALGLIVTELVINALKHAFPDHRRGGIVVDYAARGEDWTLQVRDDGVGMKQSQPGLGTSIVEALSRQLKAEHVVTSDRTGTVVSVRHRQGLAVVAGVAV
jgi:two-component sensor histidine kinase